ncbi:membrane protein insertase YidC [Parvicella tangerina]|uniref:Membrane protein insertase YidC n=1 Tax=Parvicella tangerina TaxID=2829795 RepID=A0A916NBZ4_9FLAO|nr:membrane protein insertase YidC [Parvicella tangerina]CAG5084137.1 Membrane protein insertase YidC [Parvicella tangerina]
MDKNSLIGLFLIGAILLTFTLMNNDEEESKDDKKESVETKVDSNKSATADVAVLTTAQKDSMIIASIPDSLQKDSVYVTNYIDSVHKVEQLTLQNESEKTLQNKFGIFAPAGKEQEETFTTIENDKLIVKFSSKGGTIVDVKLKEYQSYDDYKENPDEISPLQLVNESNSKFGLSVMTPETIIKTDELNFTPQHTASHVKVGENDSVSLSYKLLSNDPNKYIEFNYALYPGKYEVDFTINYVGLNNIDDMMYDKSFIYWGMKGLSTEKLADDERRIATLMYRYSGLKRDYLSEGSDSEEELNEGKVTWVAFKHKFFSSAIICEEGFEGGKVKQKQLESEDFTLDYFAKLDLPASPTVKTKLFFGPNEYETLAAYDNGMEEIINLGWGIFGWVNKWFIQPVFNLLRSWGLAMGLIILLVTLVIKTVITPLTYKNYISSAKMRVLKPEIDRINEKYPGQDQMMKRQQETSALYRSSGVNPMAGCIPMLIQMPILLAAFRFFPSSIHLRQTNFLWADDLSSYDAILSWSGDIPFLTWAYGNHISLFTLLMAASTMIYTIMNSGNMAQPSQPGMPNMKVIMYIFPVLMIFFFNNYSSGLSYYYLCGNLFNIGIMYAIKNYFIDEEKLKAKIEANKKKPKKKSKFMQRLEEVQKQQQMQQKNRK